MSDTTPTQIEFENLLTPVLPAAYRAALHFTRSPADAEDAVQQASLQAWRAFRTFTGGTNFRAWFLCIVTNVCRSEFRRQSRTPLALAFDDPGTEGLPLSDVLADETELSPEGAVISQLDAAEIQAALLGLPEEYRTVATLYFVDDLSYQEIAAAVQCPIGTVRSRLHRGRKMLMRQLWALAEERGIVAAQAEEVEDFSEYFAEETLRVA
ncbi:MAG TPA: sigma-70 family RNA polymerase sigma factor [Gemmatimonadales bacterium]|nr:sigma-70 family RNA polymerase sigma factor [Gemmatimonadales bacterium]